jgi:Holliday junction resolvase-like predicted endonuclease
MANSILLGGAMDGLKNGLPFFLGVIALFVMISILFPKRKKKTKKPYNKKHNIDKSNSADKAKQAPHTTLQNQSIPKTTYKEKIAKGKEYEAFVSEHYTDRGYFVYENGLLNGRKDGGIDLIAVRDTELIFIQCKNWNENTKYKIEHKDIKVFEMDVYNYLEKNPIFKGDKYIKRLKYTISGDFIHKSAIKYMEEKNNIECEIITFL